MTQRVKHGGAWTERNVLQKGSPKRIGKAVYVRPLLLIACEGEKTEPNYLSSYFDELKEKKVISSESCMIAPHGHTNPSGVLDDLLGFESKRGLKAKDFERRWIFIDRDESRTNETSGHTKADFDKALIDAKKKNVKVAWSNPCFELWFLLHYEFRNTPVDRSELPDLLEKYIDVKYEKKLPELYGMLRDLMPIALRNAERLEQMMCAEPCEANPMTMVHKFILENNVATLSIKF